MKYVVFFGSGHGIPEYNRMLGYFDSLQDSGKLRNVKFVGEVPNPSESMNEFLDTIEIYFPGDDALKNLLTGEIFHGNLTVIRAAVKESDKRLFRDMENIRKRYKMNSVYYDCQICRE